MSRLFLFHAHQERPKSL